MKTVIIEGEKFELVEFKPLNNPAQKGSYLLKPVAKPFTKMTKTELIEYIEENKLSI